MNCEEIEELAAAYALGALPPETEGEVEEHLQGCSRHPEIADLRAVAASLAWAAEEREPPAALKTRLMSAIREGDTPAAKSERGARPVAAAGFWRRMFSPPVAPYAVAAALALVVAALIGWNVSLQLEDGGGGVSVHTLAGSGGAQGRILYIADERLGVMTVAGLDSLDVDLTYQVWTLSDGVATGIGTFNTSEGGEAAASIEVDLTGADSVAITVEPAGGSPQPTSAPVLQADI
ncbi:MAG: anti-sigma factor [Dehalococcoidia bacterium]